ncbi:hypothetical protein GUITHDRAFT_114295 [Guillardia theta CCMP2712]|uniref:Uncharacterized protein n=2 Tax=Guillardia theta TaxID=55529 RepID=L1IUJ1_GUITC|nr:hypothetical protein GUITHDRAFT_114295 [Guillardia theta CCMP2712]EKX39569.1 hypothetical protein GUITHDRAFT_114295 [Guillardia theta CCMP2712]|eukprot:XP_005826549.1 hypothetical protein GUITHDRAFT_114295 [Guillardia theta CCMP2712]
MPCSANLSQQEEADELAPARSYSSILFESPVDHLHNPGHKGDQEEDFDSPDYDSDLDMEMETSSTSSSLYTSIDHDQPQAASSSLEQAAGSLSKHGRTWDGEARARHSERCTGRSRLTLSEKTDIIKLYYEPSSSRPPVDQKTLARMYGKSKAAISKILKPEYAHRVLSSYAKVVGAEEMTKMHLDRTKEQPGDGDSHQPAGSVNETLDGM